MLWTCPLEQTFCRTFSIRSPELTWRFYVIVFSMWYSQIHYDALFLKNTLLNRALKGCHLFCFLALASRCDGWDLQVVMYHKFEQPDNYGKFTLDGFCLSPRQSHPKYGNWHGGLWLSQVHRLLSSLTERPCFQEAAASMAAGGTKSADDVLLCGLAYALCRRHLFSASCHSKQRRHDSQSQLSQSESFRRFLFAVARCRCPRDNRPPFRHWAGTTDALGTLLGLISRSPVGVIPSMKLTAAGTDSFRLRRLTLATSSSPTLNTHSWASLFVSQLE